MKHDTETALPKQLKTGVINEIDAYQMLSAEEVSTSGSAGPTTDNRRTLRRSSLMQLYRKL